MMPLSDEDVREILRIIDESDLTELEIQTEGFSLHVRKDRGSESAPPTAKAHTSTPEKGDTDGAVTIDSPMLGTFYRAESPGAAPFVERGSAVEPDTIVCIIEVMKMMNSIPAGVSGRIVEVCPENAQLVEYGQPLFRVQPA
jgi:acetyl-CoA carboxylase biotin carboxyl carrier protein